MTKHWLLALLLLAPFAASALPACGATSTEGTADASSQGDAGPPDDAAPGALVEPEPGCNPIVGDDCVTPFPSSFHQRVDPASATGYRVKVDALVATASGKPIRVDRLNQKDGFSPATPFVVYLKSGVDASQLVGWQDPSASVLPASPVQVIEYATGKRVHAFAELDAGSKRDGDRQALLIRPLARLTPGARYVVALVGLRDPKGKPVLPAPFQALRDKGKLTRALEALQPRYEEIFAALERAGVTRGSLSLAWDVIVASDATATGHLVEMRDRALGMLARGELGYRVTQAKDTNDSNMLREISLAVQAPSFLADETGKSTMVFGPDGKPASRAVVEFPVSITVPRCAEAATEPLPVVVFGHGLFGNAQNTITSAAAKAAANRLCSVFVATDWIGLASDDVKRLPDLLSADINNVYVITDRLQQAHVNAQVMTRAFVTRIKDDPALAVAGRPVTDGKKIYYFGVSNGGIQGTTFMALTPDVQRGVLNVPGGNWSLLIERSTHFAPFSTLFKLVIPDPLDRQLALAGMQSEWDYTDALTFAPHLLAQPLAGSPVKRILMQESLGDAQVTNAATRALARAARIPGLDLTDPVPGLELGRAPLDSAYTQWNARPEIMPPLDNTALAKDNGAHDAFWANPLALQQIEAFCRPDGRVSSVCGGPCTIPIK